MSLTSVRGGAIWWTLTKERRDGVFSGKTVWCMPERFEIYIVYKRCYINTLPFLSFAMHQLRERRLTFAGHCCRREDQPVKHLVLWDVRAGRMLRGQTNRMTYVKQLLRVVRRLTSFNGWWKIGSSEQEYRIQLQAPNDWEVFTNEWMELQYNAPFQHKYGYIRDKRSGWRAIPTQ